MNVDKQEIDKFNQMVETWWDKNGSFRLIHQLNPLRTSYIVEQVLNSPVQSIVGKKVLDLGCGAGILSEALAREGARVTGLDMSAHAIDAAKQHAASQGLDIDYRTQTAEELASERPEYFDVIVCMEMIEHVPDFSSILEAAQAMLKTNGVLILSTINRTFMAQLMIIEAVENYLHWLPKGTHEYQKFITPFELITTAEKIDFRLQNIIGYKYDICSNEFVLTPNVEVNYQVCFIKG